MNRATLRSELLRLGFADVDRAIAELAELGSPGHELVAILGRSAEPSAALSALVRLADAVDDRDELLTALAADEGTAMRLLCVLGASTALADHLVSHPDHWRVLTDPTLGTTRPAAWAIRAALMEAVGADPQRGGAGRDAAGGRGGGRAAGDLPAAAAAARRARPHPRARRRRRRGRALRPRGRHPRRRPRRRPRASSARRSRPRSRLAVIAMGKCGGHELNYVSDVDVIFVHEPVDEARADTTTARRRPAPPPGSRPT